MTINSKQAKISHRGIVGFVAWAMLVATPLAVTAGHAAEKKPPFVIGVSNESVPSPDDQRDQILCEHPELIKDLVVLCR